MSPWVTTCQLAQSNVLRRYLNAKWRGLYGSSLHLTRIMHWLKCKQQSWRRRHLRIIGASLVAYNDVTKRAITTIDLKKAIAVEDDQETRSAILSPASAATASRRYIDEYDGSYGVERSFRLKFTRGQEILFFADTDEDKAKWSVFLFTIQA